MNRKSLTIVKNTLKRKDSPGEAVFKKLNGLLCLYKPPDYDLSEIVNKLKYSFVHGINQLPCRPVEQIVKLDDTNENKPKIVNNLADSVEAIGPRYVRRDFIIDFLHPLHKNDSGVLITSINDHKGLLQKIDNMRLMRVYEIKGRLGVWTDDFTPHGRLIERATYLHVNYSKMERLMSSIQATYQREMFRFMGVDVQSQEAFELASQGLLRPINKKIPPQIYSIKCTELDRPYFKIEIHTINESTLFLRNLIHDIGIKLKSYAICVQIRRIKDGFADVLTDKNRENCLAHTEWSDLDKLIENNRIITQMARDYIRKYDKTVIIGKTKQEELKSMNRKYTNYLVDGKREEQNKNISI